MNAGIGAGILVVAYGCCVLLVITAIAVPAVTLLWMLFVTVAGSYAVSQSIAATCPTSSVKYGVICGVSVVVAFSWGMFFGIGNVRPILFSPISFALGSTTGLVALVSASAVTCVFRRDRGRYPRAPESRCLDCGYDLTGNESGTCPECGAIFLWKKKRS